MNGSVKTLPQIGVLLKEEHPLSTIGESLRLFASVPAGRAMAVEMTDQYHNERLVFTMRKSDFQEWAKAVLAMLDEKVDTHTVDSDKDTTHGNPGTGPFRSEGPY